jgi:hypothetical protein
MRCSDAGKPKGRVRWLDQTGASSGRLSFFLGLQVSSEPREPCWSTPRLIRNSPGCLNHVNLNGDVRCRMSPSIRVRSLGLGRRVSLVADTSLVSTSLGHGSRTCVARLGASHEAVRRCVRRIMIGPIIFTIVLALAQIGDAEAELLPFQSSAVELACAQRTGFFFGPFGPKCRRG